MHSNSDGITGFLEKKICNNFFESFSKLTYQLLIF